jgi:hypothetical protein
MFLAVTFRMLIRPDYISFDTTMSHKLYNNIRVSNWYRHFISCILLLRHILKQILIEI